MASLPHEVFVYGTLKRGFYNYDAVLLARPTEGEQQCPSAEYVEEASTAQKLCLFVDMYGVPYATKPRFGAVGKTISGEIFRVSDRMLEALDVLEGVPEGRYSRELLEVERPSSGISRCFAYLVPEGRVPSLETREMLSEYALELHQDRYTPPGPQRDTNYRRAWGGFESEDIELG